MFSENMYNCSIDPERMNQVFVNIISNAVKNTSQENGELSISARLNDKRDAVIIAVKDNGKGISEDMLPYIFNRFYKKQYSALTEKEQTGTGLGLAIVKEIIQGHHGEVWATSELDIGSTFYISLPIKKAYKNYRKEAK